MITNQMFVPCKICEDRHGSLGSLTQIGQPVISPGRSSTTYTYYQCSQCGKIWEHLADEGFGGHGSFLNPMNRGTSN